MRTFYIFSINKMLSPIYGNKSSNVYKILNRIKKYDKKEIELARKIYYKTIIPIEKKSINNHFLMNYINNFYYSKTNSIHELRSEKEYSKLVVCNTYMKVSTNTNISSFFKDMYSINRDFFIVDFDNKDYFYLEDLKDKLLV